jgi:hypothetical protein
MLARGSDNPTSARRAGFRTPALANRYAPPPGPGLMVCRGSDHVNALDHVAACGATEARSAGNHPACWVGLEPVTRKRVDYCSVMVGGVDAVGGASLLSLRRTSCVRPGRVKTAPHLGLQERATSSDSPLPGGLVSAARRLGTIAERLLKTDLRRIQLTIWPIATAVATAWNHGADRGCRRQARRLCIRPNSAVRPPGSARSLSVLRHRGPGYRNGDQAIAAIYAGRAIASARERSPTEPWSGSPDTSPITKQEEPVLA